MPELSAPPVASVRPLIDPFGRQVTYLRISVTDRCDLRCPYCMAPDTTFGPRAQLRTVEEIVENGSAFVALGVHKIRITGGEPLRRRDIFLEHCNRVRLASQGRLLLCLDQEHSMALRRTLRGDPGDRKVLGWAICRSMAIKPMGHEFDRDARPAIFRQMNHTGG
jgi:molybdenum cofactor biosynthesis enzyme MoaA